MTTLPENFNLNAYLELLRDQVEKCLERYLEPRPNDHDSLPQIQEAMRYCLLDGGKRVRPALCIAAAEAVQGRGDHVLPAACAIEMIHTYSLIHDDLPAMDDDKLRRGKPTCHVVFGDALAILTGDALLTLAFEVLADPQNRTSTISPDRWLDATRRIAEAAGYRGMIEGQARDIAWEGTSISLDKLREMHERKTGRLIRAAVCCGAVLGGGSESQIRHLTRYADNIGLAFQVMDDILNVQGDPDKMGKAAGTDAVRGKTTYPSLIGLEESRSYGKQLVEDALKALAVFDKNADPLRAMARYIVEREL